jgi:hypothetical protein
VGGRNTAAIVHDADVFAFSVNCAFLKAAGERFIDTLGYNGTHPKTSGHLSDPTKDKRVLYLWLRGQQKNQLYYLFDSNDYTLVDAFTQTLLQQFVNSGAAAGSPKSVCISANWIICKLRLSGKLAADVKKCKIFHEVHVQKLHNCYTLQEQKSFCSMSYQIMDVFIPVSDIGAFMLISTEHSDHHTVQQRIVFIPHGSALVLPHTVYHACGLQPGFSPVGILQLQVSVNHHSGAPVSLPSRKTFHYLEGPEKQKNTSPSKFIKVPPLSELDDSVQPSLRTLSFLSALFLA